MMGSGKFFDTSNASAKFITKPLFKYNDARSTYLTIMRKLGYRQFLKFVK